MINPITNHLKSCQIQETKFKTIKLSLSLIKALAEHSLYYIHFQTSTLFFEDSSSYNFISSSYEDLRVFPRSFKLESSSIASFLSKTHLNLEGIKFILKHILGDVHDVGRFLLILGIFHKT
ncbi:hypothetical protein Hanom_Chr16g01438411 [Helianthus anomalus]